MPMIVISPIPGQETRNSQFMVGHGTAIRVDKADELKDVVEGLMADPGKMARMRDSIRKIKNPNGCYEIVKLAVADEGVN